MADILQGGGYEPLKSGDTLPTIFRKVAKNFKALIWWLTTEDITSELVRTNAVQTIHSMSATRSGNTVTISVLFTCASAGASGVVMFRLGKYRPKSNDRTPAVTYTGGGYGSALGLLTVNGDLSLQCNALQPINSVSFTYQI